MLLSKRAEMFLPEKWPAYFSKAKGCTVWDLDGNAFVDMSIMGIGTNILGYGNEEVDEAVIRTVHAGNMSTLNCPEEVLLAEKLVELHPWADMVRLARSGGEANAIAVRIAREPLQEKIRLPFVDTTDGMIGICQPISATTKSFPVTCSQVSIRKEFPEACTGQYSRLIITILMNWKPLSRARHRNDQDGGLS